MKRTVPIGKRFARGLSVSLALLIGATVLAVDIPEAQAQEIQLTGPLAGAPAVRRLRLHRDGRFDVAAHASFSLLSEFRRTIMPGLRANYHFFDWLGVGLFGGYGFSYNTALSDELQEKAVNDRNCRANPNSLACKRSAVSLCRDSDDCLADDQLGRMTFYVAPQVTVVPFRGKFSLFGAAFMDADISLFLGLAVVGVKDRKDCGSSGKLCPDSFELASRVTAAPTFGIGFNFYPMDYLGFGAEFRGTPYTWNTSGFDVAGGDPEGDFPDDNVDSEDSKLHFNPMLSVFFSVQLPTEIEISD